MAEIAVPADPVHHGGDLDVARRRFAAAPEPWIDLSTGINPHPYPFAAPPAEAWTRLPGRRDLAALCRAAAASYGAPDAGCVVAAPGSQALIQMLPRLRPPAAVAILGPTYGEHAVCWAAAGHRVQTVPATAGIERVSSGPNWDVVVVTNPNNPDGREHAPELLIRLAGRLAARGGWLVVDEAFADVAPRLSAAPAVRQEGLIVLRSFGKFFGLGGLRLGFLLAAPEFAGRVRQALGPWPVSGPAITVGTRALADRDWIAATRRRLTAEAARLDALLAAVPGAMVAGGTVLYRLVESADAAGLFDRLGRHGIFVRAFPEQPARLRFGLPADEAAWTRLAAALT